MNINVNTRLKFVSEFCEGCDLCGRWARDIYDCDKVYDAYTAQCTREELEELEG